MKGEHNTELVGESKSVAHDPRGVMSVSMYAHYMNDYSVR